MYKFFINPREHGPKRTAFPTKKYHGSIDQASSRLENNNNDIKDQHQAS